MMYRIRRILPQYFVHDLAMRWVWIMAALPRLGNDMKLGFSLFFGVICCSYSQLILALWRSTEAENGTSLCNMIRTGSIHQMCCSIQHASSHGDMQIDPCSLLLPSLFISARSMHSSQLEGNIKCHQHVVTYEINDVKA